MFKCVVHLSALNEIHLDASGIMRGKLRSTVLTKNIRVAVVYST